MSLSSALSIAQSSIRNTGRQTSVVSRNVQESGNPDYSRRSAVLSSTAPGARVVEIQRTTNEQLFSQNMSALSAWNGQSTLYNGMQSLGLSVNGVDNASSAATALGKLQDALDLYSATPSNRNLGESTLDAARTVVRSLNDSTSAIQTFRVQADYEIAAAVTDLNSLLAQFKDANTLIVNGTRAGRDVNDALDQRDATLKKIAEYVPVTALNRGDNDIVLTTRDGATLFETVPRAVTFTPATAYAAGTPGNAVMIDGVPVRPGSGGNTDASGKIAGLVQLRDSVSSTMQAQLDEVARGLITAFAEKSPSGALPDAAGLFTWSGGPAIPAVGQLVNGLAGNIRLNAAIDTQQGGNVNLLRDGGANGAGYVVNTNGDASYSGLLIDLGDRMNAPQAFDAAVGLAPSASLATYSSSAIGWFEGVRQEASRASEAKQALAVRTAEALSNETGVNVDEEMSLLLDLEHSFEASARLLKAVDEMLATLFAAVG